MRVPESLLHAIKLAREKASEPTDIGEMASVLLKLMEKAETELSQGEVSRQSRRGTGIVNYAVEKTQQGEVLTEHRGSGRSYPFRCSKGVYDSIVAILRTTDRPLLLDEVMTAIETKTGDRPADHQVRVVLRLWIHVQPSLVSRNRARYRAVDTSTFVEAATTLWSQLRP